MVSFCTSFCFVILFCTGTFANQNPSDFKYRLPKQNIDITHYDLLLTPHFEGEKAFRFDGEATLTLVARSQDVKAIKLHANQLVFKNVTLKDQNGEIVEEIQKINFKHVEKLYDFWTVSFSDELLLNTEMKLEMVYKGTLQRNMLGFYASSYEENGKTKQVHSNFCFI